MLVVNVFLVRCGLLACFWEGKHRYLDFVVQKSNSVDVPIHMSQRGEVRVMSLVTLLSLSSRT